MRIIPILYSIGIILCLPFPLGCFKENVKKTSDFVIPTLDHDIGFIPFNEKIDDPNFLICDSTRIYSGRNRIQYATGASNLEKDIISKFIFQQEYKPFSGFLVIRFIVNCEGERGRYRIRALNPDFSPSEAPQALLKQATELVKDLDHWKNVVENNDKLEYSKFINLKINHGKIEHVLL